MPLQYLSFQRPPPKQIKECEEITISPLITNDLRDEPYAAEEGEVEIRVAWVCIGKLKAQGQEPLRAKDTAEDAAAFNQAHIVKTEANITWTGPECSWKKVKLTAPSTKQMSEAVRTREGCLRLVMWVEEKNQNKASLTDTSRPSKRTKLSLGRFPQSSRDMLEQLSIDPTEASRRSSAAETVFVPVLTPPIELRGANACTTTMEKMTRNCRLVRVPPTKQADDSYLEIMEENGYELDKHIWDASFPLMSLLSSGKTIVPAADLPTQASSTVQDIQDEFEDAEREVYILELGSGTGLLSLYMQRWLEAKFYRGEYESIISSDLADSLQFTRENINLNLPKEEDEDEDRLLTLPLDWHDEGLPGELCCLINEGCTSGPKTLLILASDCSYNPDTYEAFASLLRRLWDYHTAPIYCLISKKHRHEDEKALWKVLQRHGLDHHLIDGQPYDDNVEGAGEPGAWGIFGVTRGEDTSTENTESE